MANNGENFYSASLDHSIMEWELPNNLVNSNPFESYGKAISNRTKILNGHKNSVWDLCVHPAKSSLLFSASSDGTIKFWNPKKSKSCVQTFMNENFGKNY